MRSHEPEPSDDRREPEDSSGRAFGPGGAKPRCVACDDVIGVYEPVVHLVGGMPAETSRAARSGVAAALTGPLWHRDCWPGWI